MSHSEPIRTPQRQLTHDALFYSGEEEFTGALLPFIRTGLNDGDAVIAAVTRPNIALLRGQLGDDAKRVHFVDRDEWYRRPAVTITGWQRLLDEATSRGHGFVRIIGEVAFGDSDQHPTWTRYEAALNDLFADAPSWIVCPYNTQALAPQVLADARRTHPDVFDQVRHPSDAYLPARQLLTEIAETPIPAHGVLVVDSMLEQATGIAVARQAVTDAAAHDGVDPQRIEDLRMVVTELAANALRHGSGERRVRLWLSPDGFTGEVTDEGKGVQDLLAGYQAPPAGTIGGRGLWISHQLCNRLTMTHDGAVARVRFRISRRDAH